MTPHKPADLSGPSSTCVQSNVHGGDRRCFPTGMAEGIALASVALAAAVGSESKPQAGSQQVGTLRTRKQQQMPARRQPTSASDIFSMLLHE